MFQPHSETSKAAFDHIDEPGQLEDVLRAFYNLGTNGATCEEVWQHMIDYMPHRRSIVYGTVSARMGTLKKLGRIFYKNKERPTKAGNPAEVWVHADYATEAEKLLTAEKARPKKEIALEKIDSAIRFLNSLEKGNACAGIWLTGLRHNAKELKEAIDLLGK